MKMYGSVMRCKHYKCMLMEEDKVPPNQKCTNIMNTRDGKGELMKNREVPMTKSCRL